MNSFSDYSAAHSAAVDLANLCKRDVGIERTKEFGRTVFNIKLLPNLENRYGHELTCETVQPGDPK